MENTPGGIFKISVMQDALGRQEHTSDEQYPISTDYRLKA